MGSIRWGRAVVICAALTLAAGSGVVAARLAGPGRALESSTPGSAPTTSSQPSLAPSAPAGGPATATPSGPIATADPMATAARTVVQSNLYKAGRLPASRCKEPAARATSPAKVRLYYTQFLACLNKSWAPVIRKAGFTFSAPKLVVYAGRQADLPCDLTSTAVYCDGTIYMSADYDLKNHASYDPLWTRTTMAFLIAHEYGHHVQSLAGILQASHLRESTLSNSNLALLEHRRRELQASCLSGVYLGADKQYFPARGSWLLKWRWTVRNRGDEWNPQRTHGNKTSHSRWSRAGFDAADPAACNTFTAEPATVS
ncbi:neutral zinc metallopeptidase [Kribbella sp. CA-293567]|uniref:neutral zinc metallopeptidase n=1 Tax=Kribbella sp. CA-293567 TaxID=3002436 RepID=UPI0022DCFD2A|nr:neutral zinc metallopeptidase [Kribbella sp. CA-293567]WBQ04509.1 neutral zinc metallopeptidase [Kribbella sp. CA-293567]